MKTFMTLLSLTLISTTAGAFDNENVLNCPIDMLKAAQVRVFTNMSNGRPAIATEFALVTTTAITADQETRETYVLPGRSSFQFVMLANGTAEFRDMVNKVHFKNCSLVTRTTLLKTAPSAK